MGNKVEQLKLLNIREVDYAIYPPSFMYRYP